MLEFEKKFMLTKKEYEALYRVFDEYPVIEQVNFYYDTEDFSYNRKGVTCRIRKKKDSYIATIKKHHLDMVNCSVEKSTKAKSEFDLSLFKNMNVILHGELKTKRKYIRLGNGINISLDKNIYLETEDYELEIEYSPHLKNYCDNVLRTIVMKLTDDEFDLLLYDFYDRMKESKTKSERFFARKIKGGK